MALLATLVVAPILPVAAAEEAKVELSEEQIGLISQNCASVKLQLQKVQRNDAKNRVHLGAQYETISTNLMLNLNLRLVRANFANSKIAEQQTSFASGRERFKNDYIGYSQELETLIAMDCKTQPEKFYEKLLTTRAKRADVEQSMWRLNEILVAHREAVFLLKESF